MRPTIFEFGNLAPLMAFLPTDFNKTYVEQYHKQILRGPMSKGDWRFQIKSLLKLVDVSSRIHEPKVYFETKAILVKALNESRIDLKDADPSVLLGLVFSLGKMRHHNDKGDTELVPLLVELERLISPLYGKLSQSNISQVLYSYLNE